MRAPTPSDPNATTMVGNHSRTALDLLRDGKHDTKIECKLIVEGYGLESSEDGPLSVKRERQKEAAYLGLGAGGVSREGGCKRNRLRAGKHRVNSPKGSVIS